MGKGSKLKVKNSGSFKNIENYLLKNKKSMFTEEQIINIAEKSIELFRKNTPSNSGKTAESWSYEIINENDKYSIILHNSNIQNGYNIAILVDEGHATQTGTWVSGKHYIDDTIKEILKYIDKMK